MVKNPAAGNDVEEHTPPPLVSVILPAYNAEQFVARAIRSVLAQTYPHFELLVVDDASTDGTLDVVHAQVDNDPRASVVECAANRGVASARNIGIEKASGEWIALIDADDAWRPERLARLLALAGTDVDYVFDGLMGYDPYLQRETGPLFDHLPEADLALADFLAPGPPRHYALGYLKPFISRSFLTSHGLRYDEGMSSASVEDSVFGTRMLIEGARGRCTSDPLYVYTTAPTKPIGKRWRKPRPPRHGEIIQAFEAVCHDYADRPDRADEVALVRARINYQIEHAPVGDFLYALQTRDLVKVATLLITEPAVRKAIVRRSLVELRLWTSDRCSTVRRQWRRLSAQRAP